MNAMNLPMTQACRPMGAMTLAELDAICRWLETAPSCESVRLAGLEHTVSFSVLYDQIGDTTSGLARDYP